MINENLYEKLISISIIISIRYFSNLCSILILYVNCKNLISSFFANKLYQYLKFLKEKTIKRDNVNTNYT